MDSRLEQADTDEISLMDIYDFIKDGFKTLIGSSVLGVAVGVVVSFVLPEKFQASGLIESAQVAGTPVDSLEMLAEKMRTPTYYSAETFKVCGLTDDLNPAERLAKELNPNVARQSSFVAVSYEAESPETARRCLEAVIKDVQRNQEPLARASRELVRDQIRLANRQLERAIEIRDQQIALDMQRLDVAREKLASARRFVEEFENRIVDFDFKNDQFSASSLLLATLQSKQNEAKDLQIQIDDLEMKVAAQITSGDGPVFEFEERVAQLRQSLSEPATREAQFATEIYSPDAKVAPKRALITIVALVLGGFLGLMILIGRRAYTSIRDRDIARAHDNVV